MLGDNAGLCMCARTGDAEAISHVRTTQSAAVVPHPYSPNHAGEADTLRITQEQQRGVECEEPPPLGFGLSIRCAVGRAMAGRWNDAFFQRLHPQFRHIHAPLALCLPLVAKQAVKFVCWSLVTGTTWKYELRSPR